MMRIFAPHAPRKIGFTRAPSARWRAAAGAMRFHLRDRADSPTIVTVLGGTGTGKSTIVNRLLGAEVTAASFRRTFTAGPIAVANSDVPNELLGLPHARTT